uniref:Uncharacterized protein n=1 Tax=Timema douglasi TaxID=61478 RepID=A0A7R8VCH5_TIMDO|nr:unnamed protein product [Timema douglasi]
MVVNGFQSVERKVPASWITATLHSEWLERYGYDTVLTKYSLIGCVEVKRISASVNTTPVEQQPQFRQKSQLPELTDPVQIKQRFQFWELENELESKVDYDCLSDLEKRIHVCHGEAVQRGHFTYDDPETGDRVLTRLRHFLKGACCGSACRHCIYDHIKVPEVKKRGRRFNSAFWLYDDAEDEVDDNEEIKKRMNLYQKRNGSDTVNGILASKAVSIVGTLVCRNSAQCKTEQQLIGYARCPRACVLSLRRHQAVLEPSGLFAGAEVMFLCFPLLFLPSTFCSYRLGRSENHNTYFVLSSPGEETLDVNNLY